MVQDSSPKKSLKKVALFLAQEGVARHQNIVALVLVVVVVVVVVMVVDAVRLMHPKQQQIKGACRTATVLQLESLEKVRRKQRVICE
jgi:short subunit fatty acids transporter